MAYTDRNFKTKAELKRAIADGKEIGVFQPNDMFGNTAKMQVGKQTVTLEGPHYPQPHKWYARATVQDGKIISVK
jgi:hypothetical protein